MHNVNSPSAMPDHSVPYIIAAYESKIFKRIPYYIFWPALGLLSYIIILSTEYVYSPKNKILSDGIASFWLSDLMFALIIGAWPIVYVEFSRGFYRIMNQLQPYLWRTNDDFIIWYNRHATRAFTYHNFATAIGSISVASMGLLCYALLKPHYQQPVASLIFLINFALVMAVGSFAAVMLVNIMIAVYSTRLLSPVSPLFLIPHPSFSRFLSFSMFVSNITTLGYLTLIVAFANSYIGLHPILVIWLTILAVYPLLLYILSIVSYCSHLQTIKDAQVIMINNKIHEIYNIMLTTNSESSATILEQLISLQKQTQSVNILPFSLLGIITLFVSMIAPVNQLYSILHTP